MRLPWARRRLKSVRAALAGRALDAAGARELAEALEGAGENLAAVAAFTNANRLHPDPALERRLVRLRRKAFPELRRGVAAAALPPDPIAGAVAATRASAAVPAPPAPLAASELNAETLRAGLRAHGLVWVRGLVPEERVSRLRMAIDHAFEAAEATQARRVNAETQIWYDELERVPKDASRTWVRAAQGVLAADSPRAFYEFLEMIQALGIDEVIAGYLGERPALSVEKTVLRRADATLHESTWHQDGAFLGDGIRTVDAWFALSRCGRDAPGLDLIPVRLDRVLPPGEEGTYFGWTVSEKTIAREMPGVEIWRPEFQPGDAIFFDHFLVHRTAAEPSMPGTRYAIESWFFAASVYPESSTPLVV